MDPRPIGVFDSGIGGLMAVRMLRHLLPGEPILYLGDTARMPYGDRPAGEIDRLTGELTGWLLRQNVKALIAACGTISCNADNTLKKLSVPCFDVVTAAAEAAAQAHPKRKSGSGRHQCHHPQRALCGGDRKADRTGCDRCALSPAGAHDRARSRPG